uniref:SCP2 domain-containing protein n=1 Tax=Schistocephalus solidus TaxID=70667 RepID=A0A183TMB9_SCHSO
LKRLNLSSLGQQIANLSPLLLSDPSTTAAAAAAAASVATGGGTVGGGSLLPGVTTAESTQSTGIGVSTPQVNMLNDLIQQMVSLKHTPSVSLVGTSSLAATAEGSDNSATITAIGSSSSSSTSKSRSTQSSAERKQLEQTITSALTRGQRLLDNEAARKALGGTSLQVYIYHSDIKEESPAATFYMDSGEGKCGKGVLADAKKPSVTAHLTSLDFADVLLGRLDLLEAAKASRIRISGDLLALAKLRFLLQFT